MCPVAQKETAAKTPNNGILTAVTTWLPQEDEFRTFL